MAKDAPKPQTKWYLNPYVPGIIAAIVFSIIALAMAGIIDLPHIGGNNSFNQNYSYGCPTEPDPPCGSIPEGPGIQPAVAGVYVLKHCPCPKGTHPYTEVGDTIYCECDGAIE